MISKKKAILTTVEMEIAISKYFGIREHIIVPNISWGFRGMHECDLFIVKKSGVAIEVEIKRTKSDLLADFKKTHNHHDRLNRISELYFAFPKKMYDECKELIPQGAGILTCDRGSDGEVYVRTERQPKKIRNARNLTVEERLRVAHLGCMRIWSLKQKLIKNGSKTISNRKR